MKQYTTRFLKSVALVYMAFPIAYIVMGAVLFDIPANLCVRILLSPSFYALSLLAILAGYGLWEMKRWAWYVFLPANLFIGYTNAVVVSDYGETHHKIAAFVFSIALLVVVIYRVAREVRVPYFLPRIRWWESNPRYRLSVPVTLQRRDGSFIEGDILDLSMTGCFVKLRTELLQDEGLSIRFVVFGQPLQCGGTVVWRTQSTVTHPKGVGIKFGAMPRNQRRILRAITHRLKRISILYRSSRYLMGEEEFSRRLEELQGAPLVIPGLLRGQEKKRTSRA